MSKDFEPTALSLIDTLHSRSKKTEKIDILRRGEFFSFHGPDGIETKDLLDPDHMPRITKFTDILVSSAFAQLRGEEACCLEEMPVRETGGDGELLHRMSHIARQKKIAYNLEAGRDLRRQYKEAMVQAAKRLYKAQPVSDNDIIIPVKRCGSNIAEDLLSPDCPQILPSEAKRLRFYGLPNILGAGVVFTEEYLSFLENRGIRLLEGIVASSTTECVYASGFRGWGVNVASLQCDAVITCPSGARLADDFRRGLGIAGQGVTTYYGGRLNNIWYVVYGDFDKDPLFRYHQDKSLVNREVGGDGGDLTSNTID
jgi:hypothetical protein